MTLGRWYPTPSTLAVKMYLDRMAESTNIYRGYAGEEIDEGLIERISGVPQEVADQHMEIINGITV